METYVRLLTFLAVARGSGVSVCARGESERGRESESVNMSECESESARVVSVPKKLVTCPNGLREEGAGIMQRKCVSGAGGLKVEMRSKLLVANLDSLRE
jgi:hypothetical protein